LHERIRLSFINPSQFGPDPIAAEHIESETLLTGLSQLSHNYLDEPFSWINIIVHSYDPATFGVSPFGATRHLLNILSELATLNVTDYSKWSVVTLFGFIRA
jgi:hypothetical protein